MNWRKITGELRRRYPNTNIILNNQSNPTEIICEIEPSLKHPDYSVAIAIIDQSIIHLHKKTTETYEVLKGKLNLFVDGKRIVLNKGDKFVVKPEKLHFAEGNETLVKVTSNPGWTIEDHIIVSS